MAFGKKKPKKPWVKCNHSWTEKTWVGNPKTGHWSVVTRYCSKEKGHLGGHR